MKTFEERLTRLEELADKLQDGKIPLEEAISLFEEGMKIARQLEKELSKIERRIQILTNEPEKADEEPEFELFPELNEKQEE